MSKHRKQQGNEFCTPSPPVDLGKCVPSLTAKTAVRLHPRRADPDVHSSHIGGHILWPRNEQWPTCDEHSCGYVPVLQLRKEDCVDTAFYQQSDLLQVLWCPRRHEDISCPLVKLIWRKTADLKGPLLSTCPESDNAEQRYVPLPCEVHPECVVEFPDGSELEAEDEEELDGCETIGNVTSHPPVEPFGDWRVPETNIDMYYDWLSTAPGTKVAGYPRWIQDPEYPQCEHGHSMELLVSFSTNEFDVATWGRWLPIHERALLNAPHAELQSIRSPCGWSIGDAGNLFLFVCRKCADCPTCAFSQSC